MHSNEWQPIETAPKTGETIEVSYDEDGSDPQLTKWSERRVCAGDRVYGPGWASTEIPAGENLPMDTPVLWRACN